jgi:hypothetical protein
VATDDRQVLVTGREDTPAHFRVPGNGQLRPKAVTAHYDGTNAGGDFLAALKITSDAGELVGVYPISTAIAAGGSARVSWFPGVKEVAATPSGGGTLKWCKVVCGTAAPATDPLTISSFDTNDPGNYVQVAADHWTIPAFSQVLVGYANPSAAITTNGGVVAGVRSSSGYTLYGSAGTGVAVQILPFTDLLHSVFELSSTWRAYNTGTDTHQWSVHASYFYVG